jgi:carboxyl-terminal processing protease
MTPRLNRQLDRFDEVLQRIRANYVDKPDDAKLIDGAIKGMISELDPHSLYLNAQEMERRAPSQFVGTRYS